MNMKTITYVLIIAIVFPVMFFAEKKQFPRAENLPVQKDKPDVPVPEAEEITSETLLPAEEAAAQKQEEKEKKYCEKLALKILEKDADTGEMPEAGFSVNIKNGNLEKLLGLGGNVNKYIYGLLKTAKSGYIKERIIREIAGAPDPDEFAAENLLPLIKDKSSQVRLLTARILGERGNSKAIPRLNSLLYDPYTLRKDVYPVRLAAREAIELIKLREEAALLEPGKRASKWIRSIKEKAAARQDYFCEQAVKELCRISREPESGEIKEELWQELNAAGEVRGKKTLVNNKIFGYLLFALAALKDERALPLIENAYKEVSLENMAARSAGAFSAGYALDLLLSEPAGSGKAGVLFNTLKAGLEQKTDVEIPEVKGPKAGAEDLNKYYALIKKKLLFKRDPEAYKDAAKIFCFGLNDYQSALEYLSLYEKSQKPENSTGEEAYFEFFSGCLAGTGNFKRAREISFAMDLRVYLFNLQFLDLLNIKEAAQKKKTFRTVYYTAGAFFELKAYYKAAKAYKELLTLAEDNSELTRDDIKKKIIACEENYGEQLADTLTGLEPEVPENLKLEITADRKEYKIGQKIKVKLLLKNTGTESANGVNDRDGNLGFDLIILKDGIMLKRLKNDLSKISETEALEAGLFIIDAGSGFESEIAALSAAENREETELMLAVSYAPAPALNGYEKGWIEYPVISNELKIRVKK